MFLFHKGAVTISGVAFLLLITPAWGQGIVCCAVAIALMIGILWRMKLTSEKLRGLLTDPAALCSAGLVNCALSFNFYHTWIDSSIVAKIAGSMDMSSAILVPLCAAALAAAAIPAAGCVISYYLRTALFDYRKVRFCGESGKNQIGMGKCFCILFAVYAFAISALIRANYYYLDDLGRAAFGYKHWDYFGRYVSTSLATLLHAGDYLVDISPIPQLVGMLFMAASGVLLLYIVYERTSFTFWELLAAVPLAVNPYFLECVSYRFDTPYMAASVLFCVVPLLFRNRKPGVYLFISMIGILAVCTSYQATTGIFPMLVVFLCLRMWSTGKATGEILRFLLVSVAGYFCGLVFFKMILMIPADAGYVSNSLPGVKELIPNTLHNLVEYYRTIVLDFKRIWLALCLLLGVGFVISSANRSQRGLAVSLAAALLTLVLLLLLCFGIYPVLANTIFAPRAMYAFGALLTVFGISIAEGKNNLCFKIPQAVLCWLFLVFCFTYGNALFVQKEYTDFRVKQVIADLNDMPQFAEDSPVYVQITGNIGKAPNLRNMPQDYQILNRLVPDTFGGGSDWSQYGFYLYYDLKNVVWDQTLDMTGMDLPVLEDKMYHTIRGNDSYVLIELK